jgi:hypothetical protein
MTTSRVSTSARAVMTRAATQAEEPVMWGAMLRFDGACGDEVYGNCTQLRESLEEQGQAYVLRVASNFTLTLAPGHESDLRVVPQIGLKVPRARASPGSLATGCRHVGILGRRLSKRHR